MEEGFVIATPQNVPQTPLIFKGKTITMPTITNFKFVSALGSPTQDAVIVKRYGKEKKKDSDEVDGGEEGAGSLPPTWMVPENSCPGKGISASALLSNHSIYAPHLATFTFNNRTSPSALVPRVEHLSQKYGFSYLFRGLSVRVFSYAPFTQETADKISNENSDFSAFYDANITSSITATISTVITTTPFTKEFIDSLAEAFGFSKPKSFSVNNFSVQFKTLAAFNEAATALDPYGIAVTPKSGMTKENT